MPYLRSLQGTGQAGRSTQDLGGGNRKVTAGIGRSLTGDLLRPGAAPVAGLAARGCTRRALGNEGPPAPTAPQERGCMQQPASAHALARGSPSAGVAVGVNPTYVKLGHTALRCKSPARPPKLPSHTCRSPHVPKCFICSRTSWEESRELQEGRNRATTLGQRRWYRGKGALGSL